jgi:hypothetical protein
MLKSPDVKEQHSAAQAIWALSFDEEVRKVMLLEKEVMTNLEALIKSRDEDVKLSALGALWILKKKLVERCKSAGIFFRIGLSWFCRINPLKTEGILRKFQKVI